MSILIPPEHQIIWYSGPIRQRDDAEPVVYALIKSGDLFFPTRHLPQHSSVLTQTIEIEGVAYEFLLANAHEHLAEYEGIGITSDGCLYSTSIQPSFHALEALVGEAMIQLGKDIDDEMISTQYVLDQIYDAFMGFSLETARETLMEKDRLDCHLYIDARYKHQLAAQSWWFTPDGQEVAITYIRTQGPHCTLASAFMGGKAAFMTYRTPTSLIPYQEQPEIAYGSRLFLMDFTDLGGTPTAYYGYVEELETMMLIKPHAFDAIEGLRRWSVEYWRKKYAQLLEGKDNQNRPIEELDYYIMPHRIY